MDSVLDFLFLRRLKFEYTCPPICPITPASASGLAITGQVISPLLKMNAPTVVGRFLTWPCDAGQVCFNIYFESGGLLTEVASCIQPNTALVCSAGCWEASAVINGVEGPKTEPVCIDGSELVAIPLPFSSGVEQYRLYFNGVLALASTFCGAFETCTLGCYSVSAITGDGETPPSDSACNGGEPTIYITSPSDGSTYDLPVTLSIDATVSTNGHIPAKVDFYDGATLLGTVAGAGPYSVSWTPTATTTHVLTAVFTYDGALTVTSAPVNVTVQLVLPALGDIIQWLESSDFDATPAGTDVLLWQDKSGYGHDVFHEAGAGGISGADFPPQVDQTLTLNGHATLSFKEYPGNFQSLRTGTLFLPALATTGMEIFVVYKKDPADVTGDVFSYNRYSNDFLLLFSLWFSACPQQPNTGTTVWRENFGHTQEQLDQTGPLNMGPVANWNTTDFHYANISSKADGTELRAALDGTQFYTNASYTYSTGGVETVYSLGGGVTYGLGGAFDYMRGNIAAVFLWKRVLTPTERTQVQTYISIKYGV